VVPSAVRKWLEADDGFVGPVFRTDDLMQVFRGAVIPSATSRSRSPPAPPRAGEHLFFFFWLNSFASPVGLITEPGGRPPPDYGPYQGPGAGGGRRRY